MTNILVVKDVSLNNATTQFAGAVKTVQEGSSIIEPKFYDGKEWRNLGFDIKLYREEKIGTIVYFIGDLRKTTSYPRYYAKTTFLATAPNYSSVVSKVYNSFESFRQFSAKIDPFYQNLFGNSSRDENFIKSGLFHIFCVSGMHVSILYLFTMYVASLFTYRKRLKILFSLIFPSVFVIGSGMNLPSVRALLMLYLATMFKLFDLKIDPVNTVSLIGLAMIVTNPEIAFSLSFYMTFFSTIGVLFSTNNFLASIGGFLGSAPYVALVSGVNPFSIVATLIVSIPVQITMFGLTISYILYILKIKVLSALLLFFLKPFSIFINVIATFFSKFPLIPQHMVVSIAFSITYIIYLAIIQDLDNKKGTNM
ncbi:MAG: ComEC/Rec2 family competence protein [Fervidobacterium sp.]